MTQPIAATQPLVTTRNLAVAVTIIAAALLYWLVVTKTGQPAQTATVVPTSSTPRASPALAPPGPMPCQVRAWGRSPPASSHGGDGAFLPSGQSLIAGDVGLGRGATDVQVQRFNADGSTDPAFNNPPFAYASPGDHESPAAIAVQPNGQIVVVGAHFRGTSVFGVARLDTSGSLDSAFGNSGVLTTSFQGGDAASAVLIQPDGDIVAIGSSENDTGVTDIALARYLG
jgi:uncharacterized delta-60 repeat protein